MASLENRNHDGRSRRYRAPSGWAARRLPLASLVVAIASGCTGSLKLDTPKTLPAQFNEASPGGRGDASLSERRTLATWWTQFNDPALTR